MSSAQIVLFEPEIPPNVGNIARTCVVTNTSLHLIKPLGFSLSEKHLKRSGLDYWHLLDLHLYDNWEHFRTKNPSSNLYIATTKATQFYSAVEYSYEHQPLYIIFGKESKGLPQYIHDDENVSPIRIPMGENQRSLNLSNSVAIILYEALRQNQFSQLGHSALPS